MLQIESGDITQYLHFVAVDSTDLKTRETGLTTFTVYRKRGGSAAAAMTTPTVAEADATNMPGVYSLLLDEDMTITDGKLAEVMTFHITQASMAPVTIAIQVTGIPGVVRRATAQGGAASSVTLDASASAVDDFYNGGTVEIVDGTGEGQARGITDYVGSTKVASVDRAWATNPDNTSVFRIYSGSLPSTAAEFADAVLDEVVDGATTLRESIRLHNSALGAKASGMATGSPGVFRDLADTKNRISATIDADGNRTAVTLDLS